MEEVRPCLRLFKRLRCFPSPVFGPPLRPLRRLASVWRSDAIGFSKRFIQKNRAGADPVRAAPLSMDMIACRSGAGGRRSR